jgi:hypothetical protein
VRLAIVEFVVLVLFARDVVYPCVVSPPATSAWMLVSVGTEDATAEAMVAAVGGAVVRA